ncbi:hypothetical protein SELMODRAFT_409901 [Selaginella moellendorffii]|uniref:Metallo-beta-lactamase domain-containing protein n=1 Tax=Selaginella moellendorffii TaxID=88036 RepID=D8RCU3_SELML|nr:hypothetical protein SELMODRAFT_409901 [Selaginella moellendorffii]
MRRRFVVDEWRSPSDAYFLTHLHADHTEGLSADWCRGPLYCSQFGCVLHTGDFRWNNDRCTLEERKEALREAIGGAQVDFLYLDNTFCNPLFSFPSRNAAATRVIELIRGHPEKDIVIGIDNLGKEELLLSIAQALETKVHLSVATTVENNALATAPGCFHDRHFHHTDPGRSTLQRLHPEPKALE